MQGVRVKETTLLFMRALRVNQWVKNFVVFTSIVFAGQLFNADLFWRTFIAFLIFCLLSSTSYLLNDIIDFQYDKKHPVKRFRPIASGKISIQTATFLVFVLTILSLIFSLFVSIQFFAISLFFILLHFFYSLYLKRYPIVDIFAISFSFVTRTFAGVVATGFNIPIWLLYTIFFGSLFVATVKRDAELAVHGREARASLVFYKEHLLNFLTTTFATATIIAYSFYTYFERVSTEETEFRKFFRQLIPDFQARKWMMVTIPFVVYGIARYAQLLYEKEQGERPEKIIVRDTPLIITMTLWGVLVVLLLYVL
jgi:decaprenyl-phosphate phosphoribosyltransferase